MNRRQFSLASLGLFASASAPQLSRAQSDPNQTQEVGITFGDTEGNIFWPLPGGILFDEQGGETIIDDAYLWNEGNRVSHGLASRSV